LGEGESPPPLSKGDKEMTTKKRVEHGPGVISVSSSFLGRYREFDVSLNNTIKPVGTAIDLELGVNIAHNFNNSIRMMLKEPQFEWIWFLGDDHMWDRGLLMQLLDRNVDVVGPLSVNRLYPYRPILRETKETYFKKVDWDWLKGKSGMVRIQDKTIGNAGLLVRRRVLENIEAPWYAVGKFHPEMNAPDLWFFEKLREANAELWLDLGASIDWGHIMHAGAYAIRGKDGAWGTRLRAAEEGEDKSGAVHVHMTDVLNDWRRTYDELSYIDQSKMYDKLHKMLPDQHRFDPAKLGEFIEKAGNGLKILEIGGYNGALAKEFLDKYDPYKIRSWRNIDISQKAIEESVCDDPRYLAQFETDFFWNLEYPEEFDLVIMSHVVEHIKAENLEEFLKKAKIKYLYIDAPLPEREKPNWVNYPGTHIFEHSWEELELLLLVYKFKKSVSRDGLIGFFSKETD
jgi:hypothetical protein